MRSSELFMAAANLIPWQKCQKESPGSSPMCVLENT
jgi:hypothetical protein